jgi:alpha-tubulin suppressor-like RCC1 family protein
METRPWPALAAVTMMVAACGGGGTEAGGAAGAGGQAGSRGDGPAGAGGTSTSTCDRGGETSDLAPLRKTLLLYGDNTCVLTDDGRLACWGADDHGQLGDCGTASQPRPRWVPGVADVVSVAWSDQNHCAIVSQPAVGSVVCWGPDAAHLIGATDIQSLSLVSDHSCASSRGKALCWGDNDAGQLGTGTLAPSADPVPVADLGSIFNIQTGPDYTCAVDNQSQVLCWGKGDYGTLGTGSFASQPLPTPVTGFSDTVSDIAVVGTRVFAFYTSGGLGCWGTGGCGDGQPLGNKVAAPVDVLLPDYFHGAPTGGPNGVCAAYGFYGAISCWGSNLHGQVGDGTFTERQTPTKIPLPMMVRTGAYTLSLAGNPAGESFYVIGDQAIYAWGRNDVGQLGDGTTVDRNQPTQVAGTSGVSQVLAGASHACAVMADGIEVRCWGSNAKGQLGDGTFTDRPTPVTVQF